MAKESKRLGRHDRQQKKALPHYYWDKALYFTGGGRRDTTSHNNLLLLCIHNNKPVRRGANTRFRTRFFLLLEFQDPNILKLHNMFSALLIVTLTLPPYSCCSFYATRPTSRMSFFALRAI